MNSSKTLKIVMSALMAAMCFVATGLLPIPTPTNGYIHIGDGFVLLSGVVLGPVYGALSAGIGSMLTDLYAGYSQYALATFVIKALVAAMAGIVCRNVLINKKGRLFWTISAGLIGTLIVVVFYWAYEAFALGMGAQAALLGVPTNIVQGGFGTVIFSMLVPAFDKAGIVKYLQHSEGKGNSGKKNK